MLWFRLAAPPRQIMEDRELSDNPAIEFLLNRLKSGGEFTRGQLIGDEMLGMSCYSFALRALSRMQFKGWLVVREGVEAEEAIAEVRTEFGRRLMAMRHALEWEAFGRWFASIDATLARVQVATPALGMPAPTMPAEFSIAPFNPVDPPPERPDVTPAEEPQPTQPLALAAAS